MLLEYKNKLITYGCSHTKGYSLEPGLKMYYQYYRFRKNNFPPLWNMLLADKLGLELLNLGMGGIGNDQIFVNFSNSIDEIKEGDVIVYQIGQQIRLPWASDNSASNWFLLLAGMSKEFHPKDLEITHDEAMKFIMNRDHIMWINKWLAPKLKSVEYIAKSKGASIYYWFDDVKVAEDCSNSKEVRDIIPEESLIYGYESLKSHLNEVTNGKCNISGETNGLVNDMHYGELGHIMHADICYDFIKNNPQ